MNKQTNRKKEMNMKRMIAWILMLTLLLSGCGGGAVPDGTPVPTEPPVHTTAPAETTAPEKKKGNSKKKYYNPSRKE